MIGHRWSVGLVGVLCLAALGCGSSPGVNEPEGHIDDSREPLPPSPPPPSGGQNPTPVAPGPTPGPIPGLPPGPGTDPHPKPPPGPGPWPLEAALDYSEAYGTGWIQSAATDDDYNIWLLSGDSIGVLRPGTTTPVWTSGVGQASRGFSREALAQGSSVICGGQGGQAYVGYITYDLDNPGRESPDDPEYQRGDMDAVRLQPDGSVVLENHLGKTTSSSGYDSIGIRNTNDWHYDEDRSVLTCVKVMRGRDRGDIYIGTNHGVTLIRGLVYNAHRHPVWNEGSTLKIGYNYAVGISQSGDLLIGNEWKVGMLTPPAELRLFDDTVAVPFTLNTYAPSLNSLEEMDFWRGFQQTVDGTYYLASERYGLWRMQPRSVGSADFERVSGLPTSNLTALQATDDGSLFVGTGSSGLWRQDGQGNLQHVSEVRGSHVRQLVYDPTVTPSMLLVVVDGRLVVLRGY